MPRVHRSRVKKPRNKRKVRGIFLQLEGKLSTFELHWMVSDSFRLLVSSDGGVDVFEPQSVESKC